MAIINQLDTTKIYTATLIDLFNDIQLQRRDATPYTVPIYFGDKDRLHKHLDEQLRKNSNLVYSMQLPAMSLSFDGIVRNLERQTNNMLKYRIVDVDATTVTLNFNDSAFDFEFTINLVAKNMQEMLNITQYILSKFKNGIRYVDVLTPLYTTPISTPIVLNALEPTIDSEADDYGGHRLIEATMPITVKGIIHNNVTFDSKKISIIKMNTYLDLAMSNLVNTFEVI